MPSFSIFVVELRLHVLGNIRVIGLTEPFQSFDDRNDGSVGHLLIHVVPLDPHLAVSGATINFKGVPVVGRHNDCFGAVGSAYAIRLHLGGHYFNHISSPFFV